MDEVWSFVGCKEDTKPIAEGEHPGDVWTWTALDPVTKLIASWHVGGRGDDDALAFCFDLAGRVASGKIQITSDGLPVYGYAVPFAFLRWLSDRSQWQPSLSTIPADVSAMVRFSLLSSKDHAAIRETGWLEAAAERQPVSIEPPARGSSRSRIGATPR